MDPLTLVLVAAGFVLLIAVASRLGGGSVVAFEGMFGAPSVTDLPQGVQETDVPRFRLQAA